jgi:hypothetical protein
MTYRIMVKRYQGDVWKVAMRGITCLRTAFELAENMGLEFTHVEEDV